MNRDAYYRMMDQFVAIYVLENRLRQAFSKLPKNSGGTQTLLNMQRNIEKLLRSTLDYYEKFYKPGPPVLT